MPGMAGKLGLVVRLRRWLRSLVKRVRSTPRWIGGLVAGVGGGALAAWLLSRISVTAVNVTSHPVNVRISVSTSSSLLFPLVMVLLIVIGVVVLVFGKPDKSPGMHARFDEQKAQLLRIEGKLSAGPTDMERNRTYVYPLLAAAVAEGHFSVSAGGPPPPVTPPSPDDKSDDDPQPGR